MNTKRSRIIGLMVLAAWLFMLSSCGKPAEKATGSRQVKYYTAIEAFEQARKKAISEWQDDAYLTKIVGGGSKAPVTRDGRTAFWQFQFYSPSAKKGREITVDHKKAIPVRFTTVPYAVKKQASLEGWMDSPKVVTAAEILGGSEARAKYKNIGLWYLMESDGKQTICTVSYFLCVPREQAGLTHGSVLQFLMDGQSGQLIQMQVKDGKLVQ